MYIASIKISRSIFFILIFTFIFFLLVIPRLYAAPAEFSPLVGLPGITDMRTATLPQYINAIYLLLIGLGGLIAVVRISWIGVKYSMSESVINKVHAKEDIIGAFTGLAILLIPYIVLMAINPNLTSLDVLKLDPINVGPGTAASQAPATIESPEALNYRIVSACIPVAGRPLLPSCPQGVDLSDAQNASQCVGYYDITVKTCFSKSSTFTYTVGAVGADGNYSSFAEDGWVRLCGGDNNIVVVTTNNTISYRCK